MSQNYFESTNVTKITADGLFILYMFKPSIIKPLLLDFEPMSFVRRCRYLLEYMHPGHYTVFYLAFDNKPVGFCVVSPGGRSLKCSSKEDIILGPYYIDKEYRGKGYSKRLIRMVLENYNKPYRFAFDWIMKSNKPSIAASIHCGFHPYGELNIVGLLRKPVMVDSNGQYTLYRFDKSAF